MDKGSLTDEETFKIKSFCRKIEGGNYTIKNSMWTAYQKQWEGHANFYKQLSEKHEQRTSNAIDSFDKQLKDSEEACMKEVHKI